MRLVLSLSKLENSQFLLQIQSTPLALSFCHQLFFFLSQVLSKEQINNEASRYVVYT